MNVSTTKNKGFTLLEVLLAIFIFSVVITAVYGSYRTTFRNIRTTEVEAEQAEQARIILERLTVDLESIYSGEGGFLRGQQEDVNDARGDSLSFTSTAHLVFHRSAQEFGLTTLSYSASPDERTGAMKLYRMDKPMTPGGADGGDEGEQGELLGEGIASFAVSYADGEGGEEDSWESEREKEEETGEEALPVMPRLVRIELRMARSPDDGEGILYRTAVAIPGARVVEK